VYSRSPTFVYDRVLSNVIYLVSRSFQHINRLSAYSKYSRRVCIYIGTCILCTVRSVTPLSVWGGINPPDFKEGRKHLLMVEGTSTRRSVYTLSRPIKLQYNSFSVLGLYKRILSDGFLFPILLRTTKYLSLHCGDVHVF